MVEIDAGDTMSVGVGEVGVETHTGPDLRAAWKNLTRDLFNPTVIREGDRRRKDNWGWKRWRQSFTAVERV
jgi:hypothetical protein